MRCADAETPSTKHALESGDGPCESRCGGAEAKGTRVLLGVGRATQSQLQGSIPPSLVEMCPDSGCVSQLAEHKQHEYENSKITLFGQI